MTPKEVFAKFIEVARRHMKERDVYDTLDRVRDDSLEYVLIEKGIITKEEVELKTAEKLIEHITFLESKDQLSPIQRGDITSS